jgi:hypothetical protein
MERKAYEVFREMGLKVVPPQTCDCGRLMVVAWMEDPEGCTDGCPVFACPSCYRVRAMNLGVVG